MTAARWGETPGWISSTSGRLPSMMFRRITEGLVPEKGRRPVTAW